MIARDGEQELSQAGFRLLSEDRLLTDARFLLVFAQPTRRTVTARVPKNSRLLHVHGRNLLPYAERPRLGLTPSFDRD